MVDIKRLIQAEASAENAAQILKWFEELELSIMRGDMMIGLLNVEALNDVAPALEQAAAGGKSGALALLAHWYESPPIDAPNLDAADAAYAKAVAAGVPGVAMGLARLRWYKRREEASPAEQEQAIDLVKKELAEDPEDTEALYLLGLMTCGGFGTEKDPAAAFKLQQEAAELCEPDAMFEAYVHLSTGLGVEADEDQALEYLKEAAEADHPRAAFNMGAFYATGKHFELDMAKAASWYEKSCEGGNGKACATLGAMYAQGSGVPQDLKKAGDRFELAEEAGFDASAFKELVDFPDDG